MARLEEHPLFNPIRAALVAGNVYGEKSTLSPTDLTTLILNSVVTTVRNVEASESFGWFYKWEAPNGQG